MLHERQWRHDDVGGAILIRAFQLQYNVTGAVGFEPFIGDGRAGDVAAQLLELVALIHGAAHRGVEAEALLVDTQLWRILRLQAGNGIHLRKKPIHLRKHHNPPKNAEYYPSGSDRLCTLFLF